MKPLNLSYVTPTSRVCEPPCVCVCVWGWERITSPPVSGGLFQLFGDVCVTSSPLSCRRPSAQAGACTASQSVLHRPALCRAVLLCAELCRAVPGGARLFNPPAEFIYSHTRQSQKPGFLTVATSFSYCWVYFKINSPVAA